MVRKTLTAVAINKDQIKRIKTLQRQAGMADEDYRAMLWKLAKVWSCTNLRGAQIDLVMRHLERCAGQEKRRPRGDKAPDTSRQPREKHPILGAIENRLADLGKSWRYANGIAKRMFGIAQVNWLKPDQAHKVLVALEYAKRRQAGRPPKWRRRAEK